MPKILRLFWQLCRFGALLCGVLFWLNSCRRYLDIPFSSLDIATVGDAMALLLLLENRLGMTCTAPTDGSGNVDLSKLAIHFENEKANELLARWIAEHKTVDNRKAFAKQHSDTFSAEEQGHAAKLSAVILEETKQSLTADSTPLHSSSENQ